MAYRPNVEIVSLIPFPASRLEIVPRMFYFGRCELPTLIIQFWEELKLPEGPPPPTH